MGQLVKTGQLIGYVGRTGQASNPHCHFAIKKDGARQVIPGLVYGQWVRRRDHIPGNYLGIGETAINAFTFTAKSIVDALELWTSPSVGASVSGTVPKGTTFTVTDENSGYYRIVRNGAVRWVVNSGAVHALSKLSNAKVTAGSLAVRTGPGTGYSSVGSLSSGTLVTVFDTQSGWHKILFDYPAYYRWAAASGTASTSSFRAMVSADTIQVRTGPGPGYSIVGELQIGTGNNIRTFSENRNGWYRILWDGSTRWIAGWRTAGPGVR